MSNNNFLGKQYPFMTGDGEGGISPSASKLYGPWDSEADLIAFLNGAAIPNGLIAAFRNGDGTMTIKKWRKPTDAEGYWRNEVVGAGVIHIAGVIENAARQERQSYNMDGDDTNIYYIRQSGFLGRVLTRVGNAYLYSPMWKNMLDYGTLDENDNVVPFDNALYVTRDGQMYLSTSEDIQDLAGGGLGDLTTSQRAALDSGITSEMVTSLASLLDLGISKADIDELKRLKEMNIVYDSTEETLAMTDPDTDDRNEYPLTSEGGDVVGYTYGTPTISLSYGTSNSISGAAGQYLPAIVVTQDVLKDGTVDSTSTYSDIKQLKAAFGTGDSISFEYDSSTTNTFDSLDAATGKIVANANSSGSDKPVKIKVTVTLKKKTNTAVVTVTQSTIEKLFITDVTFAVQNGSTTGTLEAVPTLVASDENHTTYSVSAYTALSTDVREGITLSTISSPPTGVTFNSTTGVFTIDTAAYTGALNTGEAITLPLLRIRQDSSSHNVDKSVNIFGTAFNAEDKMLTVVGVRGSSDSEESKRALYKGLTGTVAGVASLSFSAAAGDIILIFGDFYDKTNNSYPAYMHVIETTSPLTTPNSGGTAAVANPSLAWSSNSTSFGTATNGARANYLNFVKNSGGNWYSKYTDRNGEALIYKVKGTTGQNTYVTVAFYGYDSGSNLSHDIYIRNNHQ